MKLEEGMHVRTLKGIVKIDEIKDGVMKDTKDYLHYGDFIKASHNIKELLEVGDIITYEFPTGLGMLKYENVTILESLLDVLKSSDEYKIKSIVTKEQFEQMEYKVGE